MKSQRTLVAIIFFLGVGVVSQCHSQDSSAQVPPKAPPVKKDVLDEKTIGALITQLGDDSFEKREAAAKRLAEIGEPALKLIRTAASENTDAEVRERAEKLVQEIENRLYPFVWTVRGHKKRPNRITLTPDGKQFVSSGYETLCLGNVATGKVELTFGASPKDRFYHDVAIFADGKRALVGAEDKIVRLFDLGTGKELRQFVGHQGGIRGIAILPGEKRAITGSMDKSLRLWDVQTGKELAEFPGVLEAVRCLALSPDGQTVAVGHYSEGKEPTGTIRLWHVEKKQELREFPGHTREVTRVSFSTDGKRLVSSSFDRTVRIWDVASGKELKRFECGSLMECAYFVDGERRVLCSGKEMELTVQLWDVEQGKRILRSPAVEGGSRDVAPLMGGGSAVAAGVDGTIRLWQWRK